MIISKTPLRVSLFGGNTDIGYYYKNHGGCVINTTIDKYVYVIVKKRFEKNIKLSYSSVEEVTSIDNISHPIIKACLIDLSIFDSIEIITIADIPAGTGLGSSSSFTVGLLNALYHYLKIPITKEELARKACYIEIELLKSPIGKQDQYAAVYGGINLMKFNPDETVELIGLDNRKWEAFWETLRFIYLKKTRDANTILIDAINRISQNEKVLTQMKNQTMEIFRRFSNDELDIDFLGTQLHQAWQLKKTLSNKISYDAVDNLYNCLKTNSLISGGKILGAGGGGFLMVQIKSSNFQELINENSIHAFKMTIHGSRIIINE